MTHSTVVTWQIDQCVFLLTATSESSSHVLYFFSVDSKKRVLDLSL